MIEGAPTALNLFNPQGPELERLGAFHQRAVGFGLQTEQLRSSIEQLNASSGGQIDKIKSALDSHQVEFRALEHVFSPTVAFRRILVEFRDRGGLDQEAYEFFEKCFRINTAIFTKPEGKVFVNLFHSNAIGDRDLLSLMQGPMARKLGIDQMYRRVASEQPSFFAKTARDTKRVKEWPGYAATRVVFSAIFQKDPLMNFETRADVLPPWMIEARQSGKLPSLEELEEFREQCDEKGKPIRERILETQSELRALEKGTPKVRIDPGSTIEQGRKEIFGDEPQSLEDLLISLQGQAEVTVPLDKKKTRTPEQHRKELIERFVGTRVALTDQKLVALYLESVLGGAGYKADEPIQEHEQTSLNILLQKLNGDEAFAGPTYQLLEDHFPLVYQTMEKVRPFVEVLTPEQRIDLAALVDKEFAANGNTDSLIWHLTGAFRDRAEKLDEEIKKRLLDGVRGFTKRWLEENWQGAYQILAKALPTVDEKKALAQKSAIKDQIDSIKKELASF